MADIYRSAQGAARVQARYQAFLDGWPVPWRERRLRTGQGETFVIDCGREDGPPLVLLHGSGGNSAMWSEDVACWAASHRIYAVDLIGDPGRSAPSRPALASGAYAAWLDDVFAGLSLERAVLVGMSLGGWLALDYAIRHPARVERLVLFSPGGIGRQRPTFLLRVLPLLLLGGWGRRHALQITSGPGPDPSAHQRQYLEFLSIVQQEFRRKMDPLPVFADADLGRLTMPVLAIVGGRDVILDSAETRARLLAHVPDAQVLVLPAASHAIWSQAEPVLAFLQARRAAHE